MRYAAPFFYHSPQPPVRALNDRLLPSAAAAAAAEGARNQKSRRQRATSEDGTTDRPPGGQTHGPVSSGVSFGAQLLMFETSNSGNRSPAAASSCV